MMDGAGSVAVVSDIRSMTRMDSQKVQVSWRLWSVIDVICLRTKRVRPEVAKSMLPFHAQSKVSTVLIKSDSNPNHEQHSALIDAQLCMPR